MRRFSIFLVGMSAVLVATSANAQTPAPAPAPPPAAVPAPPAALPDKMPWDTPYGPTISVERAAQVAAAIVAEAKKGARNWTEAISIVDGHGELVYFYRMDDTAVGSIEISYNKARAAARLKRPSQALQDLMQNAGPFIATLDRNITFAGGGFLLIENGKIIGAVGCSGARGDQDIAACKAGADLIK